MFFVWWYNPGNPRGGVVYEVNAKNKEAAVELCINQLMRYHDVDKQTARDIFHSSNKGWLYDGKDAPGALRSLDLMGELNES